MTRPDLVAMALLCAMLGAMLGGSALGVREAYRAPEVIAHAAAPADAGAPAETDPEDHGDGVMTVDTQDDADAGIDDEGEDISSAPHAAVPTAPTAPRAALVRRRDPHMVTSDDVPAGPAQGYVNGRPVRIVVTRLDGKPVETHTAEVFLRMRAAAQRDHINLRIVSGFRTMAHQQALYRAYRHGHGSLAAVPGQSNHQSGHALDLNTSTPGVRAWLDRNGRRFGFRRTVPQEAWHWEWWPGS